MDRFFRVCAIIFLLIGSAFGLAGIASFALPETSDISVLYDKLGKHLLLPCLLVAQVILLSLENKKLRLQLKGKVS